MSDKNRARHAEILGSYCGLQQAADYAEVSTRTIRRWVRQGLLKATRAIERGSSRVRINTESLRELLDK